MPYRWNPHFVGREAILASLRNTLCENGAKDCNHRVALYGMGGVGKTQVAIEYVKRYESTYEGVYWVQATDRASILSGFHEMARAIGCIPSTTVLSSMEIATLTLTWLRQHERWLVVFDNLDDITAIEDLLPETTWNGHTIITTRNPNVSGIPAKGLEVPVYDELEAVELLLTRAEVSLEGKSEVHTAEAKRVVRELGYLPLGIEQAAAYIREETKDLHKFLPRYKANRKLLHVRVPTGNWRYKLSVATTWDMSFQSIKSKDPSSARLLQLFAFLNPDGISIDFLVAGKDGLDPTLRGLVDSPALETALFSLEQFSLVGRLEGGRIIVHRLVQSVIRDNMSTKEVEEWSHVCVSLCELAFPKPGSWNGDLQMLNKCRQLQEQVIAPLMLEGMPRTQAWGHVATTIATFLLDDGKYGLAEDIFTNILDLRNTILGPDHPDTSASMDGLGRTYRRQGRLDKAAKLQGIASMKLREILGEGHEATLDNIAELAFTYWKLGKVEESSGLCELAVETAVKELGDRHATTLKLFGRLATIYWGQGRLEDSARLDEAVLEGSRAALGEQHPDTLLAMHNLALTYRMSGKLELSVKLDERALAGRRRVLGDEHPDTIHSMINLAVTYAKQGATEEAAFLQEAALTLSLRVLGEQHPKTLSVTSDLAMTRIAQNQLSEASALLRSILQCREAVQPGDVDTIAIMVKLSWVSWSQGELEEANHLARRAYSAVRSATQELGIIVSENTDMKNNDTRKVGEAEVTEDGAVLPLDMLWVINALIQINQRKGNLWQVVELEEIRTKWAGTKD